MKADFEKFKGTLPYASESFGIFQPLLGWKSKRTQDRMFAETRGNYAELVDRLKNRVVPNSEVFLETSIQIAGEIDSLLARQIVSKLDLKNRPSVSEWQTIINSESIRKLVADAEVQFNNYIQEKTPLADPGAVFYLNRFLESYAPRTQTYTRSVRGGSYSPILQQVKVDAALLEAFTQSVMDREKRIAQTLLWLSQNQPAALERLFFKANSFQLTDLAKFIDPIQNFGESNVSAVLSPVGIIHIFRQYFFEFDSFLGTPAGHVWLSPGGTVELVEISTRKVFTERAFETATETLERSEVETRIQDELSDAIKEENQNNFKFGFGASGSYSTLVVQAEANTNLDFETSKSSSRETTHKQMREQSEKLTGEIKKSFKSTFRVTTNIEEASSKRYVIQNTTDRLVNYELRRKMRQVGVQIQDINSQLCWQVFVDDPGRDLGIAKLVHIAEPPDLSGLQPPEAPVQLPRKSVELMVQFPYENISGSHEKGGMHEVYTNGDDGEGGWLTHNDKIIWIREYQAEPPAPGYSMDSHIDFQVNHSSVVSATVQRINADGKIKITLNQVNFDDQPVLNFKVITYWNPPDQAAAQAAFQTKMDEFSAEKLRLEKEAYVKAAQERINSASRVASRKFEELREEERMVVYRKLIGQLINISQDENRHILSELIRSIFDIDNMLYFVAPEWWRPKLHQSHQTLGTSQPITDGDVVSWGGADEAREDNYYVTDESIPAKMGSSLGWLLQLDGDNLRNAFLNSPWVKAVIPIRPGKEAEALNWLQQSHVEGADGLDNEYHASAAELLQIKPDGSTVTLRDALNFLAKKIQQEHVNLNTPQPSPFDPGINLLPTEVVYEHGFNPLAGGVKINEEPYRVFSQWLEILPTDQIVALEYDVNEHL